MRGERDHPQSEFETDLYPSGLHGIFAEKDHMPLADPKDCYWASRIFALSFRRSSLSFAYRTQVPWTFRGCLLQVL